MKINEQIRALRCGLSLTQEQVAEALGVTASAVSEWEGGSTLPDVAILPDLARVLDTDPNTLLDFQPELTQPEIAEIINKTAVAIDRDGFDAGFRLIMEQVKTHPGCDQLSLNAAMLLDGARMLNLGGCTVEDADGQILALYERAARSTDPAVQSQAMSILISRLVEKKDFDKAYELLKAIPDPVPVDKKMLRAKLLLAQERRDDAAAVAEEKLLRTANEVIDVLRSLISIAEADGRRTDADALAEVFEQQAKLFSLSAYTALTARFELAMGRKDAAAMRELLPRLLEAMRASWNPGTSVLYLHLPAKKEDPAAARRMRQMLLQPLATAPEAAFMREDPEICAMLRAEGLAI